MSVDPQELLLLVETARANLDEIQRKIEVDPDFEEEEFVADFVEICRSHPDVAARMVVGLRRRLVAVIDQNLAKILELDDERRARLRAWVIRVSRTPLRILVSKEEPCTPL